MIVKPFVDAKAWLRTGATFRRITTALDIASKEIAVSFAAMQLRRARLIPDGKTRHRAVKHARDELRRARKRAIRR